MATTFTETPRDLAFLLSEANGYLSRENITIASGSNKLKAGTVLGKITIGAITTAAKSGGNTGNGTISGPTALAGAKAGIYKLRFTAATTWTLLDPDGFSIGTGVNGTANDNDLAFTTTAGGTAFVAGDGFDITVAAGSGKYVASPAAITAGKVGAETAVAVLGYEVDATSADVSVVAVTNDAEVKQPMLVFDASVDDSTKIAAKIAQLRLVKIKAR
jgi:hypothetical protein